MMHRLQLDHCLVDGGHLGPGPPSGVADDKESKGESAFRVEVLLGDTVDDRGEPLVSLWVVMGTDGEQRSGFNGEELNVIVDGDGLEFHVGGKDDGSLLRGTHVESV